MVFICSPRHAWAQLLVAAYSMSEFMWMFVVLVTARWLMVSYQTHYFLEMFFDLLAILLIWPMANKFELKKVYLAHRFLKHRKNFRKKVELILGVVLDGLRLLAVFFLGSWLWRWAVIDWYLGDTTFQAHYLTYVDAFLLCYFLAQVATAHRWGLWVAKIPLNWGRQILIHYLVALLLGTLLLVMPFSIAEHQSLKLLDALFIAGSAISVTGLSPVDIGTVLSFWGHCILLILIQLGGLGIIMVTAALSLAANKRLSLSSIALGQAAFGRADVGGIPQFLAQVTTFTLFMELLGSVVLYLTLPANLEDRLFQAIFHSISAFCNAGFSLLPNSLYQSPFGVSGVIVICFLVMIGGLGFPVIFEIWGKLHLRSLFQLWARLSAHAKLALTSTAVLWLLGWVLFFIFEEANLTSKLRWWEVLGNAIFYSISARTAGFNLAPLEQFHISVHFFLLLLMMIGANPTSTGGGMKTTTVGVILATVYSTVFNKSQNIVFHRAIPIRILKRSLVIVIMYLFVAGLAITLLSITEKIPMVSLLFEVVSALSTVGLSLNATAKLTALGKLIIIFLMIFGRVGILTIVLAGIGEPEKLAIRYPEDDFVVG